MSKLESYLAGRVDEAFLSSDDVVHAVLPLIKQLIETHEAGMVAPLEGLHTLSIEHAGIWYAIEAAAKPKYARAELRRVDPADKNAFRIISEASVVNEVGEGIETYNNLSIVNREDEFTAPVYLPGYICWEHQLNHHDPLSDIFIVGQIIASLACNLNLNNREDLQLFVENRQNLFNINPELDPVIAKTIVQTTELSRHNRMADLQSLFQSLKHYRDQEIDIDFELLKVSGFEQKPLNDKQQIVLNKLRERLFEISRRNKLLHFSATQQTVNLTQASVPLTCDLQNIKADSLLTWGHSFKSDVLKESPVLLNKYVNTLEALYLPGVFDRLRAEANRDLKEFGFAQLRLVLCFLAWSNLKDSAKERFYSPLVLLPVELSKKKGVKDKYWLEALDVEAEINPVVRHQFSELYGIDLPETIDLRKTELVSFHQWLAAKIESSDQSISLELIDKPKIDIIHQAAKRRLEHYNRRAGLSGRGILKYEDIDYSYNSKNFHPLGLSLFNQRIRKTETQLQRIIKEQDVADMQFMVEANTDKATSTQEKTRAFYSIREDDEINPYRWQFDICNITLGNFKYRKMSLVKDYTRLLESPLNNKAFEASFSLNPRPIQEEKVTAQDIGENFHVVPCDPTQAEAIGLAKKGESYIIQGPPGTGKSQTITNLIADYVARDKKVLFVCEKRAAIDVVYLRLKQQGFSPICSLIHDSQTDKKHFIMDLKATYETFIDYSDDGRSTAKQTRDKIVSQLLEGLKPLKHFDDDMTRVYESAGIPLNDLLTFVIQNKPHLPDFSVLELEYFPDYAQWESNRSQLHKLTETIYAIQKDGVLANHPFALLNRRFIDLEQPMNEAARLVDDALGNIDKLIDKLKVANDKAGLDNADFASVSELQKLLNYAHTLSILARPKLLCLLDPTDVTTQQFEKTHRKYLKKQDQLEKAQKKNDHWREKLPADETENALLQVSSLSGFLAFLKPGWWQMRKVLNNHYDFPAHKIKPSWLQVLTWLNEEHKAQAAVLDFVDDAKIEFGFECDYTELLAAVEQIKQLVNAADAGLLRLHNILLEHKNAVEILDDYININPLFDEFNNGVSGLLQMYEDITLPELKQKLTGMHASLSQLPEYLFCLKSLSDLPDNLSSLFVKHKINPLQLETTIAHKTVSNLVASQPVLNRMVSSVKQQYVRNVGKYHKALYENNARTILDKVRSRFLQNMHIMNLPAAKLTEEQKEFKKKYNKGRRELEHEFGKTIRFKSIRNMVANQSGIVINDLKRVWLMSPLSVSDTLPLNTGDFDVVIFDEASQITLEEAIPSVFRANQSIVVGDQMQLPPTNFFSAKATSEDDESLEFYENDEIVKYELNSNSFLSHVSNNLVSRRLGWHYRSRSEALISFSNSAFYQGSLLTVPDVVANTDTKPAITVTDVSQAEQNVDALLSRAVSFHWLERGIYENRRNANEATYIANMVRKLLQSGEQKSIGIIAFSESQQSEIEKALNKLADEDRTFRNLLEEEYEREKDGEYVGLLVKNLENIQGDERDIIILSVCYGYNPQKKMRMNFGPINQKGGEKRLNVAFSRAKQHMVVVSSIQYSEITNDFNEGANALKTYLHYAEAISGGDEETANRILFGLSYINTKDKGTKTESLNDPVLLQIKEAFEQQGWIVDIGVGHSRFKCDLAIRKPGEDSYRLGVFLDTKKHYKQLDIIERDLLKPQLLREFGWHVIHLLCKDWYEDAESVLRQIQDALDDPALLDHQANKIDYDPIPAQDDVIEDSQNNEQAITAHSEIHDKADSEDSPVSGDSATAANTPLQPVEETADSTTVSVSEKMSQTEESGNETVNVDINPANQTDLIPGELFYLEFVEGQSSKFWSVVVNDNEYQVHYGRIGTQGQSKIKQFETAQAALAGAKKVLNQKLKKGYCLAEKK